MFFLFFAYQKKSDLGKEMVAQCASLLTHPGLEWHVLVSKGELGASQSLRRGG